MKLPPLTALILGVGAIACARSALEVGHLAGATSGTGGAPTTGGGGGSAGAGAGGGMGGAGGIPGKPPCGALLVKGGLVDLGPTQSPALFASTADGLRATMVAYRPPFYGFPPGTDLHHVSFEPWGPWPPQLPSPPQVLNELALPWFAAAPMDDDGFACLYTNQASSGSSPARLALRVPIAGAGLGPVDLPLTTVPSVPRFLAHDGGSVHFFGVAVPNASTAGPAVALRIGWADSPPAGNPTLSDTVGGCADDQMVAEAIHVPPDRWLMAVAAPQQSCASDVAPAAGSRRWLRTSTFTGMAGPEQNGAEWFADEPVAAVALASRPGGAWLSFRRAGGPIEIAALSGAGTPLAEPFAMTLPDEEPGGHVITTFGPYVAVVFVDLALDHPQAVVRVFDDEGLLLATLKLPSPDEHFNAGALGAPAVVVSPNGVAMLVLWTDWNGYEDAPTLGHALRLECLSH